MTSDLSNYHREYSPYSSYSLFKFETSDVISALKNSIEYSSVFIRTEKNDTFPVPRRHMSHEIQPVKNKKARFRVISGLGNLHKLLNM